MVGEKSSQYTYEKTGYKGIAIQLARRKVRDYALKDIQKSIDLINRTRSGFLKGLKEIVYLAETMETWEYGKEVLSRGWYNESEKILYLFNRGSLSPSSVLNHELGHHVFHELLEKRFGRKILGIPNGREEIADIIVEILRDKTYGRKLLIETFRFTPQEIKEIEQILGL